MVPEGLDINYLSREHVPSGLATGAYARGAGLAAEEALVSAGWRLSAKVHRGIGAVDASTMASSKGKTCMIKEL